MIIRFQFSNNSECICSIPDVGGLVRGPIPRFGDREKEIPSTQAFLFDRDLRQRQRLFLHDQFPDRSI